MDSSKVCTVGLTEKRQAPIALNFRTSLFIFSKNLSVQDHSLSLHWNKDISSEFWDLRLALFASILFQKWSDGSV